jgi:hypothetical protein
MVFAVSNEAMTVGFVGGEANGREYEGLKQALLRYNYAVKNNAWEYPMEYYDNEGSIFIRV